MMLKEKIRSSVGTRGMMIYTPDQLQVCIAYDVNGDNYTIKNEPACLWKGKEEIFHAFRYEEYTTREEIFIFVRLALEILFATFLPMVLMHFFDIPIRLYIGFYLSFYSFIYLLEFSILSGLHRRKTQTGQSLLRWRGALNKAINAFEQYHRAPIKDEIERASIYRHDKDHYMKPHEITGVFFAFLSVPFFMPTIVLSIISVPILILLAIVAYQTSFFGLLKLTSVAEPTEYEIQMSESLMDYWFSLSYKDTLQSIR